jgi:hypothetical protein
VDFTNWLVHELSTLLSIFYEFLFNRLPKFIRLSATPSKLTKTSELDIGEKYKKEPYKKKKDAREGRAKQQASDGEQTLAKASSR